MLRKKDSEVSQKKSKESNMSPPLNEQALYHWVASDLTKFWTTIYIIIIRGLEPRYTEITQLLCSSIFPSVHNRTLSKVIGHGRVSQPVISVYSYIFQLTLSDRSLKLMRHDRTLVWLELESCYPIGKHFPCFSRVCKLGRTKNAEHEPNENNEQSDYDTFYVLL